MSENKVQIKPVKGKDADAIWVYPVDAKEILASGTHVLVAKKNIGEADWLPEVKKKDKIEKEDVSEDDSNELTDERINSMTTNELEKIVQSNGFKIDNFHKMNLNEKRKAVIAAFESLDHESDDGDL